MEELKTWAREAVTLPGSPRESGERTLETRDVYRKGTGPGVIIIHEVPGIEPGFVAFAEEVVAAGFTVWLPRLFGTPGAGFSLGNVVAEIRQFCVRREFSIFARGRTSDVAHWLRGLASELHRDAGGPGVGVIGMCFTGGFALMMMADDSVIAPVLAEPSLPAAIGFPRAAARRGADLGLDAEDVVAMKRGERQVLGLRYRTDAATGTQCAPLRAEFGDRFATLRRELGERFLAVEFEGAGHSVLTVHRRDFGVDEVIGFLSRTLRGVVPVDPERDPELERFLESRLPPGFRARITRDPYRVVLFVERGLTKSGVARVEAITSEATGATPEIVRVAGGGQGKA